MPMKPKHRPDRKADVARDLARLKGQSKSDLARDDKRMATSPLGHGMGAKKMEKERTLKRSVDWHSLPRESRLARVMFPHLADAESQQDMSRIARGENKRSPLEGLADRERARLQQQNPNRRK
jgi:hypothetical protein